MVVGGVGAAGIRMTGNTPGAAVQHCCTAATCKKQSNGLCEIPLAPRVRGGGKLQGQQCDSTNLLPSHAFQRNFPLRKCKFALCNEGNSQDSNVFFFEVLWGVAAAHENIQMGKAIVPVGQLLTKA